MIIILQMGLHISNTHLWNTSGYVGFAQSKSDLYRSIFEIILVTIAVVLKYNIVIEYYEGHVLYTIGLLIHDKC
jgi:hypothetical protein